MAANGEKLIGISYDYRAGKTKDDGLPIEAIFPTEGSGWDIDANALLKKGTINPASYTFLDWAISNQILMEYAKNYPIPAMDTGISIPAGYPADPLAQLITYDLEQATADRERILQEWTMRYGSKSEPE